MNKTELKLYAARDTSTGKLVSDITNPRRKYWDVKGRAESAIDYYNRAYANRKLSRSCNKGEHGTIELVTFKLVEVEDVEDEDEQTKADEEMADAIFEHCNAGLFYSEAEQIAHFVIEQLGYHKQSEGEWRYNPDGMDWGLGAWECSVCRCRNDNLPMDKNINPMRWAGSKFCPNCGAKMKGRV